MKLEFQCWKCPEGTPGRRVTAPFNENASYSFTCAQGHVHNIILVQMRFEVLAETAMQALVDGYYREAVASFAAALERIYQFYVEVVSYHNGVGSDTAEQTWKAVANQSERQLGMFVGLYQVENNCVPPLLAQKHVAFRNKVIHQGYIPTEGESAAFAQAVVDLVQPLLNAMMPRYIKTIEALCIAHLEKASAGTKVAGTQHRVFFEFVLKFDTEADDWDLPPADVSDELRRRRTRAT